MNWTGGRLSRGARHTSVKDKQRQHFARVRNNLLNGKPNPSPISWATFHEFPSSAKLIAKPEDGSTFVRGEVESLRDEYGTSPLMHTRPQKTRDGNRSRPGFPHLETSSDIATPMTSPVHRPRSNSHDVEHTVEPSSASRAQKRQRRNSQKLSIELHDRPHIPADAFDENRLKLLLKRDWTGLNMQRPVRIKFSSATENEMLGKRRRLPERRRAKYGARLLSSPFAMPRLRQSLHFETSAARDDGIYLDKHLSPKEKAKIIISGRKLRSRPSSSVSRSKRQENAETMNIASSDFMLLDQDENGRLYESSFNSRGDDASDSTNITLPTRPRHIFQREIVPKSRSLTQSQTSHSPVLKIDCYGDPSTSVDRFRTDLRLLGPNQIKEVIRREAISQSPRALLHPVPRSSKISQIILSSPTIASSIAGQLGSWEPAVPKCGKLDDEIWKTWVVQTDEGEIFDDEYQGEMEKGVHLRNSNFVRISPGVSVCALSTIESYEEKLPSDQTGHQAPGKDHQYKSSSTTYVDSTRIGDFPEDNRELLAEKPVSKLNNRDQISKAQQRGKFSVTGQQNNQPHLKVMRHEDPDACWKRFVFPTDDEADEAENANVDDYLIHTWAMLICKSPTSTAIAQASSETTPSTKRSLAASSNFAEPAMSPYATEPLHENCYQVIRGSHYLETSSSPSTNPQASDSIIVHAPSRSDRETALEDTTNRLLRPKVVFSKPKPFKGQLHTSGMRAFQRDPVHIGRRCSKAYRKEKDEDEDEDIRNLEGSEEVESIEDD